MKSREGKQLLQGKGPISLTLCTGSWHRHHGLWAMVHVPKGQLARLWFTSPHAGTEVGIEAGKMNLQFWISSQDGPQKLIDQFPWEQYCTSKTKGLTIDYPNSFIKSIDDTLVRLCNWHLFGILVVAVVGARLESGTTTAFEKCLLEVVMLTVQRLLTMDLLPSKGNRWSRKISNAEKRWSVSCRIDIPGTLNESTMFPKLFLPYVCNGNMCFFSLRGLHIRC